MRAYVVKCGKKYAGRFGDDASLNRAMLFSNKKAAKGECFEEDGEKVVAVEITEIKK